MSGVRGQAARPGKPVLGLTSDLHLSNSPPGGRKCTRAGWYEAMAGVLGQVRKAFAGPWAVAGDIFDVWNSAPELISFAITHLPKTVFAVPGQHDLPNHRYEDRHRSGYGVLVAANRIVDLHANRYCELLTDGIGLEGYPWGRSPDDKGYLGDVDCWVAVGHHLCWQHGAGFPGAPADSHADALAKRMPGFALRVFGDNHQPFHRPDIGVLNCGAPMRRTRADIAREPCVWLLHDTGFVERVAIDDPADWYSGEDAALRAAMDPEQFVRAIKALHAGEADFEAAVRAACRSEPEDVQAYVSGILAEVTREVK